MMDGQAIGAQPLAQAGLREAASAIIGPRPDGVRSADAAAAAGDVRTTRASKP